MKSQRILAGLTGLSIVVLATAATAAPTNIVSPRAGAFAAPGMHQFYVWCGNGNDHLAYERGTSGQDALNKLSDAENASGNAHCRPVWQGRVLS
jgi:hypothetical protein